MHVKNGRKDLKRYQQISSRVRDTLARLLYSCNTITNRYGRTIILVVQSTGRPIHRSTDVYVAFSFTRPIVQYQEHSALYQKSTKTVPKQY